MDRRTWLAGALAAASIVALAADAAAQNYPARPIQGTIQWGAGGSTDNVARAVTPLVEAELGQKIVLTNRPGGTGVIGMQFVHSQRSDGYNLLYGAENPQLYGVLGLSELSYRDFYPVSILARGVPVIVARADAPWTSFRELVDDVRSRPRDIKMGATGTGGLPFVVHAMIQSVVDGFEVTAVPFEGDGPGLTALQGGHVDFMPSVFGATRELISSGRVKLLTVVADEPVEGADAPPITADFPEFGRYLPWGPFFGAFVKADTPDDVKAKLVAAYVKATSDPQFISFAENFGVVPMGISGEEAQAFLDRWQSVTAWLLQDTGAAKVSPEELGIARLD
jgi:tripartite-type tricarboxylate transporter receptor subunit TctC